MVPLDQSLFHALTAGPDASGWVVLLATLAASWIVPLVALGLLLAWVRGHARTALLDAVAAGLLGLAGVQVISWFIYRPRPFELGQGLNLLHHLPENSFPSDHATLMFALASSLILSRQSVGWLLLTLGLGVGWARIYLGVHWPSDIGGGFVLGLASAVIVKAIRPRLLLWAWAEQVYLRLMPI